MHDISTMEKNTEDLKDIG